MSDSHLPTYLNDHLAGSEVALELLEHLQRLVPGAPAGQFPPNCKPKSRLTGRSSKP
jgi:hypothetical protein